METFDNPNFIQMFSHISSLGGINCNYRSKFKVRSQLMINLHEMFHLPTPLFCSTTYQKWNQYESTTLLYYLTPKLLQVFMLSHFVKWLYIIFWPHSQMLVNFNIFTIFLHGAWDLIIYYHVFNIDTTWIVWSSQVWHHYNDDWLPFICIIFVLCSYDNNNMWML
jgi:hypothetical protein